MAQARIVYEGTGGGGDLFLGMKFWLSQRIPSRNTYKGYLESNGGAIVPLESQANMIIADHARKDCPVGSISWKWIEDSVKKGSLEDIEKYRAGPAENQVREAVHGQPTRKGRTTFTAEDDKILMEWCTRAEQKGLPLFGNKIYVELAQKYPRHTHQSWRDHWVKQLAHRARPELSEDDEEEEEEEDKAEEDEQDPANVPAQPRQPPNRRPARRSIAVELPAKSKRSLSSGLPPHLSAASPVHSEKSQGSNVSKSFEANPFILKSDGGNVFTDEETQLLFDQYDSIIELSDDQIIDAWIAWSMAHPNHTPQEWHNHFKEYIIPTKKAQIESRKLKKQAKETAPSKPNHKAESTKPSSSKSETARISEVKDSQGSSGQTIAPSTIERKIVDPCLTNPLEFEKNLQMVADSLDLEVNFKPVICGRVVPLFGLWQVVQSDEFGGYDAVTGRKQWHKVATKLNFNPHRDTEAASDLKACYGEILADFEGVRRDFLEEEGLSESQDDAMIEAQLRQTAQRTEDVNGREELVDGQANYEEISEEAEEQDDDLLREHEEHDDDLEYAQISPRRPRLPSSSAGKRRLGADRESQDLSLKKRQRIDKGKEREIPSTPEDVINSHQTIRTSHQPSPLKFAVPPSSDSEDSDSSVSEIVPIKLERHKPAAKKQIPILEPETQDFHYSESPQYPPPPEESIDDDEDLVVPRSNQRPPPELSEDDDEEEDIILVRESSPPAPKRSPERRNISTGTTRGSLHSSSNNYESSTQSQTESQNEAELLAFIDKQVSDGYAQEIVIEALHATTMAIPNALTTMDSLADGDGIPENIPGVWTRWDDEALEARKGTPEYQRVVSKHGISRIGLRKRFLKEMKTAVEELEEE